MLKKFGWQQAVGHLGAERGRAETAASVIKRLGTATDVTTAELVYGNGRAEVEAITGVLLIALAEGRRIDDLPTLEARMVKAVASREALGDQAMALARAEHGSKEVPIDLLAPLLPTVLGALQAIWRHGIDSDKVVREAIAARLQDVRWQAFRDVAP